MRRHRITDQAYYYHRYTGCCRTCSV